MNFNIHFLPPKWEEGFLSGGEPNIGGRATTNGKTPYTFSKSLPSRQVHSPRSVVIVPSWDGLGSDFTGSYF